MVVVNARALARAMRKQKLTDVKLADRMGMSFTTVQRIRAGQAVGSKAQIALFNALGGTIPFAKLFTVTAGPDAEATPEQAKERVA